MSASWLPKPTTSSRIVSPIIAITSAIAPALATVEATLIPIDVDDRADGEESPRPHSTCWSVGQSTSSKNEATIGAMPKHTAATIATCAAA